MAYVNIIIVLFVTVAASGISAECPDGFVTHQGSCYHFSHDTENWFDALDACEKLFHAKLVEIETDDENQYLLNATGCFLGDITGIFWTGGNDLQVEGEWHWFTSGASMSLNTWHPGNPSNSNGDENCMALLVDKQPLWNDDQCHKFEKYICEKKSEETEVIG